LTIYLSREFKQIRFAGFHHELPFFEGKIWLAIRRDREAWSYSHKIGWADTTTHGTFRKDKEVKFIFGQVSVNSMFQGGFRVWGNVFLGTTLNQVSDRIRYRFGSGLPGSATLAPPYL
jgi:hypothetical protein